MDQSPEQLRIAEINRKLNKLPSDALLDLRFVLSQLEERDKRIEELKADLNEVVERHT